MRRLALVTFSLALLAAPPVGAQKLEAEVIHWWTSGGESAAVKVLAERFAKAGGTWIDTAIAGGTNARVAAINRAVAGNPPAAMQFNTGKQFDELVENNLLADVEAVATAENWKAVIPEAILNATTRQGKLHAVPVNIHGQNWVWYNKAVLARLGGDEPRNWDEAFPLLDKAKAAGFIPMAFSGSKTWEMLLFDTVLLDRAGPAIWVEFYGKRDPGAVRSPQFRAAAETYARLRSYVDPGAPGRNWNDATALVIQGKALMQVMGDWAKGEFAAAHQTAGKDYGCTLFGSRGGGLVIGGDVFVFPRLNKTGLTQAQEILAKVMLEPETQLLFAQKKGSIPVRLDVDSSSLDLCAQRAVKTILDKSQQVPAPKMLASPALVGALQDVYSQFWNNPGMPVDSFIDKVAGVLRQGL